MPVERTRKRLIAALAMTMLVVARPAVAQEILRDAETEAMFAKMAKPIIEASGLSPDTVKVVLLQERPADAERRSVQDAVTYCPAMALAIEEDDR